MDVSKITLIFALALSCVTCEDGHIRGSVEPSPDGGTYLTVAAGNNCEEIRIDGVKWPHAIGKSGAIRAGTHVIDCNGEIGFIIPAGKSFTFDYWGP